MESASSGLATVDNVKKRMQLSFQTRKSFFCDRQSFTLSNPSKRQRLRRSHWRDEAKSFEEVKYNIGHVRETRKEEERCVETREEQLGVHDEKRCKIYLRSASSLDVDQFFQWVDLFFRKKVERKLCKLLSTRRLSSGRNEGWIKQASKSRRKA